MEKQKKMWLIVAIIVVVFIVVITLTGKKASEPSAERGLFPEEINPEELPTVPEAGVEAEPVIEGTNPVTIEGVVITPEGTPVKTENLFPGDPETPTQSAVLTEEEKEQVRKSSINLEISYESGFVPKQFKVKPGQAITILLTSTDSNSHNLAFRDASLRGIGIYIGGGESKAITFNAPTNPGLYDFVDSFRIENNGQMIVTND